MIAPYFWLVSLMVLVPDKLRLLSSINYTFSGASMLLLFKFILTVLFILNVSLRVVLLVRYIVSLLLAALMASSRVS